MYARFYFVTDLATGREYPAQSYALACYRAEELRRANPHRIFLVEWREELNLAAA